MSLLHTRVRCSVVCTSGRCGVSSSTVVERCSSVPHFLMSKPCQPMGEKEQKKRGDKHRLASHGEIQPRVAIASKGEGFKPGSSFARRERNDYLVLTHRYPGLPLSVRPRVSVYPWGICMVLFWSNRHEVHF